MSEHDVMDPPREQTTLEHHDERTAAFVDFLESEFPSWDFALDSTSTWSEDDKPLWIATREGHHPQSALTAAKLHRRLSDYEEREAARFAGSN